MKNELSKFPLYLGGLLAVLYEVSENLEKYTQDNNAFDNAYLLSAVNAVQVKLDVVADHLQKKVNHDSAAPDLISKKEALQYYKRPDDNYPGDDFYYQRSPAATQDKTVSLLHVHLIEMVTQSKTEALNRTCSRPAETLDALVQDGVTYYVVHHVPTVHLLHWAGHDK